MPRFTFQARQFQPALFKPKAVWMGAARYDADSWAKVMSAVVSALVLDARYRAEALYGLEVSDWAKKWKSRLLRPVEAADGWWLEGIESSLEMMNHLRWLLAKCGYPTNEVTVECEDEERIASSLSSSNEKEKIGAYARRMFANALDKQVIPERDFQKCLSKKGTQSVLGVIPGGCPLFSRTMIRKGQYPKTWVKAFPSHFGFSVFVNSQWIEKHRKHLQSLFRRWGVHDDGRVAPVQKELGGNTEKCQEDFGEAQREDLKIGAYAKRELFAALEEERVTDADFRLLSTLAGTKQLLGVFSTTFPLFSFKPMIRHDGRVSSWKTPAKWRGQSVYVNHYWIEQYRQKLDRLLARWRDMSSLASARGTGEKIEVGTAIHCRKANESGMNISRFAADIRNHWPEGFDFSEGALRLVESRCGKIPQRAKEALKAGMFHPRGRLWFCPENVASDEVRDAVVAKAQRFVREWGLVAAKVLSEILDVPGTKLRDDQERETFAIFLARQAGLSVCELEGRAYATDAGASDKEETAKALCELVREFISEQGGLSQAERILEEFKNLDEQSLSDLMARWEPDVIPERDENGFLSFKLLSEYYLPEDFGEALKEGVAGAEEKGMAPTAAWLAAFLSERYGCDFAEDYALDPAGALKWAIGAVWRNDESNGLRRWEGEGARARFVAEGEREGATLAFRDLAAQVEAAFPGVFTNEDFWQYSVGHYGLSDTKEAKIAQLGYIAPCFVRLDRDHWMSVAAFREATGWNDTMSETVAEVLRDALGTSPMLPVASLGASVTDALPEMVLRGDNESRALRWTPELVASVAALLCPGVHVANHGANPYAVSALLVSKPVAQKDVFAYAMGLYCARNPRHRDVKEAFAFLQANHIRFRFTARAQSEIEAYLAQEGR